MRYVAKSGSQLGHAYCFGAPVVDTTVLAGAGEYEPVCETFDLETAELIAAALNAAAAEERR